MAELIETEIKEELFEEVSSTERTPSDFLRQPRTKWALAVLAVLLAASAILWRHLAVRESTDDAQIDGHIIPMSARVGGTVVAVEVRDNQYAEAGTVLVRIDPRDYQVALERAEAELSSAAAGASAARTGVPITSTTTGSQVSTAQARLESAKAGLAAAGHEVEAARARRTAAKARLDEAEANEIKAQHDFERMKQLVAKDEISQQQFDAALAAAKASQATVESARAALDEAGASSAVRESKLAQARADLTRAEAELRAAGTAPQQVAVTQARAAAAAASAKEAQAALDQAKLNLEYTVVRAPASGQISKKTVEVGQVVQPSQPLLAVVPLDDIWVTANFKETQLKTVRPGQPVIISVDTYGGRKYRGHVESIAAATGEKFSLLPPENATGNYVKVVQRVPVKILFDKGQDPEHLLRPGMSVTPTVLTK